MHRRALIELEATQHRISATRGDIH